SFDGFKKAILEKSISMVDPGMLLPTLTLHGKIAARDVGEKLYEDLNRLAPFGQKNSQPIFEIDGLEMTKSPKTFGNNHIKFFFKGDGREVEAVGFDMADRNWNAKGIRFAGILDWDDYRDQVNVRIVDWKTD
ncbi:MAG: hypothetical protein V4507_03735, partial [Verrucomicrobiota bacterium]